MKKGRTINEAIIEVLKMEGRSLSAKDIYSKIIELDFYKFKAAKPFNVLLTLMRRHCAGLDFPTASKEKYFRILTDGTYDILKKGEVSIINNEGEQLQGSVKNLKEIHRKYLAAFKKDLLDQLKAIEPNEFENFSKKLLEVYGFIDLKVTKMSRDGGIDGYGKLKVGISHLSVAFQCKRWKTNKVSRVEVDKFRGATQGDYEQAILFTTSEFSKEAQGATTKKGAIPVILVDGESIIDLMIDKKFGVEIEGLPIYLSSLDDVLF